MIVAETLATQFASAGPDHPLPDGSGTEVVVGDNHAARILVVKR